MNEILAFSLVILFSLIMTIIFLNFFNPVFKSQKESQLIENAINYFKRMKFLIDEISSEAVGSKRVFSINLPSGNVFIKNNSIIYQLQLESLELGNFERYEGVYVKNEGSNFEIKINYTNIIFYGEIPLNSNFCILKEREDYEKNFIMIRFYAC
jgi:hypothetical protein